MVEHGLSATFAALAHDTRRALLVRLAAGPATISSLAEPFPVSFFAVSKHLRVLEAAGLVERSVSGREHHFALKPGRADAAARWLAEHTRLWAQRLDALERQLRERQSGPDRRHRKGGPE